MSVQSGRFARRKYCRRVVEILDAADFHNPGRLTWEQESQLSSRQVRRWLERQNDMDYIWEAAHKLLEALGCCR